VLFRSLEPFGMHETDTHDSSMRQVAHTAPRMPQVLDAEL
jgi:hypothetical protein